MKYYIIAGEASGDLHASNMMKELVKLDPEAYFRVWGGDKMMEVAQELAKHIKETSFMGVFSVITNLKTIKANFRYCEEDITRFQPDVLILIDNSGFNLRIAKFVKKSNLSTTIFYYILPQAWAWKRKRVHTIQGLTDKRFAILPFEKKFYQSYGYDIDYVGHPILDSIANQKPRLLNIEDFRSKHGLDERPIIALLPGSRKREIRTKLPIMLTAIDHYPDYQFVVAGSETVDKSLYSNIIGDKAQLIFGETYNLLSNATAALVTSGTATLETALFRVPQVVCYKPGWLTYHLLKRVISIKYICMVNLILDKLVVTELIENRLNEKEIKIELDRILNADHRNSLMNHYQELEEKLGGAGASQRVATMMNSYLRNQS